MADKKYSTKRKRDLTPEARIYFRDQLRDAVTTAQKDSEGFQEILFTVEKLGITLLGDIKSMGDYKNVITKYVEQQSIRDAIAKDLRQWHLPFTELYDIVKDARNEAFHSGAVARHITKNAIRLALILEEALMADAIFVREFMVRDPTCAYMWQPVSLARQQMLANSFTFLPILDDTSQPLRWMLLADFQIVKYLRRAASNQHKKNLLAKTIGEAVALDELQLIQPNTCNQNQRLTDLQNQISQIPFLVLEENKPEVLLGILTPFDML